MFSSSRKISVVQSDVRPTGDNEVRGLTPARSGNILSCRNIFYCHSLPLADSRRTVMSFLRENVHKYRLIA